MSQMLQDAAMSSEPTFSPTGLAADADMIPTIVRSPYRDAADRLAEVEIDRDFEAAYLDAELPAGGYFTLAQRVSVTRTCDGKWNTATEWRAAMAFDLAADDMLFSAAHPTPAGAATELVELFHAERAKRAAASRAVPVATAAA